MNRINIWPDNLEIDYIPGKNLMEILVEHEIFVDNPCNGLGVCGKCKIKYLDGPIPPVQESESKQLADWEFTSGIRFACTIYPEQDLTIQLLQKEDQKPVVLTAGEVPEFYHQPAVMKKTIMIERPLSTDQTAFELRLMEMSGCHKMDWQILKAAPFQPGSYTAVLYENRLIGLEQGDTSTQMYGLAVDIGTTTMVAALIDLCTGTELAVESMVNPQKSFGSDVLSRISYCIEHPHTGLQQLQQSILAAVSRIVEALCRQANVDKNHLYDITVAANTTMQHLLLGVDPVSIGQSPYVPVFTGTKTLLASDLGLIGAPGMRLCLLPSVSAYIGADIVAGVYAARLTEREGNILFIDIGTNGEIVLKQDRQLTACSCAAGPALEGMNISCGMQAAPGAVEDMIISNEGITLSVIGEQEPAGICGSGIMSVVKELLRVGLLKENGALQKEKAFLESDYRRQLLWQRDKKRGVYLDHKDNGLSISQKDIRQVQLAKGAILSGFYALLNEAGLTMEDLDGVIIAGQFGAHLTAECLIGCGLLPSGLEEKMEYIGNSSKTGAYMSLLSTAARTEMERLAKEIGYLELSTADGYEDLFVRCLAFPKPLEGADSCTSIT